MASSTFWSWEKIRSIPGFDGKACETSTGVGNSVKERLLSKAKGRLIQ